MQRYWEMRLGELLRAAGWQLSSSEEGPDFKASKDDRVVWVEAVAPKAGTTEDRLPDDYTFPDLSDGGVAFCVPAEKIVLRVRTAIDSKHKALVGYSDRRGKYHPGYRDRGIVDAEDGYVIAVNTALLGTCGDEGSHLPSVVEAVFPTGPREIDVNRKTRQVIREGIGYRPVIRKQNDAPVFTSLFLDEAYRGISGIMGLHERPEGRGSRMPIMVHNPLAANGLPDGWCAAAYEFRVVDARDHWELKWRSTAKLTGGACGT